MRMMAVISFRFTSAKRSASMRPINGLIRFIVQFDSIRISNERNVPRNMQNVFILFALITTHLLIEQMLVSTNMTRTHRYRLLCATCRINAFIPMPIYIFFSSTVSFPSNQFRMSFSFILCAFAQIESIEQDE